MPKLYLSNEELTNIINDYNNGISLTQITKKYHHDRATLKRYFQEHNIDIKLRTASEALKASQLKQDADQKKRKYHVQDDYFSTQNSKMAYILGFLMADGNVSKENNKVQINLAAQDLDFLNMIYQENGGSPVVQYDYNGRHNCRWECISSKIKKDLATYDIIPNKTGKAKLPEALDKKYYPDFIRGYFDGDGCISKETHSGAVAFEITSHNKEILEQISAFFEENGVPKVNIRQDNRSNINYSFRYRKQASKLIYNILYYNTDCLCLKRKYDKYTQIILEK